MKLHSMIIAGGAGLLLLGACSPSSYQTTFPEPAYVKVSTNNGAYAPYPDDPVGQQELVYWYNSLGRSNDGGCGGSSHSHCHDRFGAGCS